MWGSLLIESRNLTRQILTLIKDDSPNSAKDKEYLIKLIAAFSWALNFQLRNNDDTKHLERLLSREDFEYVSNKRFRPVIILKLIGNWLSEQYQNGKIDSIVLTEIDKTINNLSQIIGGCERISNTPLPFPYSVLLHRSVYIYCFLLPFGLVDVVSWMMPFIVLFISYTFIALDALIQEIEEPFGEKENDLPLNMICENIEFSIFEQAGMPTNALQENDTYFRH